MEIEFSYKLELEDYKKYVVQSYYFRNKKRLFGYGGMMVAGILLLIICFFDLFGWQEKYPGYTLYLLGASLIITPLLFYRGVIRATQNYYKSSPNVYNEVKFKLDNEKLWYQTQDGNTGTCLWSTALDIKVDDDFIIITTSPGLVYLWAKRNLPPDKLLQILQILQQAKGAKEAFGHLQE